MTPADIIRQLLLTEAENQGFAIFSNHLPDKPDKAIGIYDMRGSDMQERLARSGDVQEYPIVEVHVRDAEHATGSDVLGIFWETVLKPIFRLEIDGKILHGVTKNTTMWSLGQEPRTRRVRYVQQFKLTLE